MEDPSHRKLYIALTLAVLAIIVAAILTGGPSKFLRGDFNFDFAPGSRGFEQASRGAGPDREIDMQPERIPDLLQNAYDPDRVAARDAWRKSDDPSPWVIDENGNVMTKGQYEKKKKEDAEKKKEEEALQKEKNKIFVSITPGFAKTQVFDASKISLAKPATAASYRLCTQGNADAVIKSVDIESFGSSEPKHVQLLVNGKASSSTTKISDYWNGDFLTVNNLTIPAGKCSDFQMNFVDVDPASTWQTFRFKNASANLPLITKGGDNKDILISEAPFLEFVIHNVFKPISHVYVQSPYATETEYVDMNDANPYLGMFALYTKPNSTAKITGIKVRLTGYDKNIPVTMDQYSQNVYDESGKYPEYPFKASPKPTATVPCAPGAPCLPPPAKPTYTLEPNKDVLIPLNADMNYFQTQLLYFHGTAALAETNTLRLAITDVITDATAQWQSPSPLLGWKVVAMNLKGYSDIDLHYSTNPEQGNQKWDDSAETQKKITDDGYSPLASITFMPEPKYPSLPIPPIKYKNMKVKFTGTFNAPLTMRINYGEEEMANGGWKSLYTPPITITKNSIVDVPDFVSPSNNILRFVHFELVSYPPIDPKFVFSVKATVQSADITYDADTVSHKKGDPVELYWLQYDKTVWKYLWVPMGKFPQPPGIVSVGPTLLTNASNDAKVGVTYVNVANLPSGIDSQFTVNSTCFAAQGNQEILELTYQHASRETSPFSNIKLAFDGNNVVFLKEVFLKPKDWTKEYAVFTLTTPHTVWNSQWICFKLDVINPKEAVEDFWFSLIGIKSQTLEYKNPVPVYADSKPLSDGNPLKGSVYTFK